MFGERTQVISQSDVSNRGCVHTRSVMESFSDGNGFPARQVKPRSRRHCRGRGSLLSFSSPFLHLHVREMDMALTE